MTARLTYGERRAIATLNGMLGSRLHVATLERVRASLAARAGRPVVHELAGVH